jgi:hypothetical protein
MMKWAFMLEIMMTVFLADWAGVQIAEKVVPLVVDENEGGELLHINFPHGFHSEFREV